MKKLESGRSMVEMLGVLAIIGVLSVGGIAGYSLGMRKHRANGVADIASKYALISYNDCQQKILNGEKNVSIYGCDMYNTITFNEAGIGNLPAGVKSITPTNIELDQYDEIDRVSFSIEFDSDTLCNAYGSIIGTGCNSTGKTIVQTIKYK